MIEGARRIGKTTVAKEFGRLHYAACATIDFSRGESSPVKRIMTEEYSNLDKFFFDLQSIAGKTFVERDTLIIFDEVQSFPPARQMIKSLVEDGRYDYIETGSLISIKQNVKDILIPSGERKIRMHPMDFEEFLWANDDYATMDRIRYCFEHQEPLGESVHRKIMNMFSTYMLIGGMPEAVCRYIEKNGPKDIETVKRSVIDLYIEDSGKIPGIGVKCRMMLSRLP